MNLNRSKNLAVIEATLAVIFWGGSFIATKYALQDISPVSVIWLRFGIGFVILGAAVVLRGQFSLPSKGEAGYFTLLGFIGITFHQWMQSTGLVTSQASTTAWIVATTPIFMALLGWLVLKERLSLRQIGGIMVAACGVLLVVSKGDLAALARGRFGESGDLLVLISAPNWAVFSVLSRRGLQRSSATRMMFYVMGSGWLLTTILFLLRSGPAEIGRLSANGWLGILFLGIFCSGLAYIFWYDALQALLVAQAGAFVYLEPFVTVVFAALLLGEPLLAASLIGGGTILGGVWLVQQRHPPKRRGSHPEVPE
jgi:drug/metabolite transporter (DMT)-like permease